MNSNKRIVSIILAILLLGGSFFLGLSVGNANHPPINDITTLSNKESGQPDQVDFSPFWKAWGIVNEKYVATHSTTTVSDQDRVYGAIKGMVDSLGDPYTTFFPPADAKVFQSEISGNFEGVGLEMGVKNGILTVISALKNTPAARAGIQPGDQILKINDADATSLNIDEAVQMIRGPKGTKVTFTLLRNGEKQPIVVSLVRETINIPTIDTKMRSDGVFVISLYNFSADSPNLFRNALREFINAHTDKLVLDLRGNPGGYLDAAVDMASWFLPTGDVIVQEDYGQGKEKEISRSKGYNIFSKQLKMAILINGGSASASEILGGALQEHGVAKLVGQKSFGKGSVQELVNLTPDTALKVTVARWLTPNGKSISDGGLTPDLVVPMTEDDVTAGKDPQMEAAANLLKSE
ncbi:MAG TPA: S41 family peptidase [Candidatus Paceibacterota bacterium]|nr:S41 family peptidase [Candidatus Paceibacterota bacterium]